MPRIPPKGRPIQPGETRNPKGSSVKARALSKLRRLTNEQVSEIGTLVLEGNREGLQAIGKDPDASVLKVWMASLVVSSMKKGDPAAFRAILDRICGRPRESVTLSGDADNPLRLQTGAMTDAEKAARADALAKLRAQVGED